MAILVAIAARGMGGAIARSRTTPGDPHLERLDETSPRRTYLQFVALTIVNPATVIYFAALILGLPTVGSGAADKVLFVIGAAGASFAWQLLISTIGSLLHQRVSDRVMSVLSLAGYGIVALIAANIARGLLDG